MVAGIIKALAWNLAGLEQIKGKDEMQLHRDWLSEKLKDILIFEGSILAMLELSIKYKKLDHPKELFFIETYNKLEWSEKEMILDVTTVGLIP